MKPISDSKQEPAHCGHEMVCWMFRENPPGRLKERTGCMANHKGCRSCSDDTRKQPPANVLARNAELRRLEIIRDAKDYPDFKKKVNEFIAEFRQQQEKK